MPQMSSLYWLNLYMYFTMFMMIMIILIFFMINKNYKFNNKLINKMSWKFKW